MASKKKTEANRKNAQKSTGPRSARGKSLARFNAIKTGVFAMQPLLFGEDENERAGLAQQLMAELAPMGTIECMLVDQIVGDMWRLKRVEQAEGAYLTHVTNSMYDRVLQAMSKGEIESLHEALKSPENMRSRVNDERDNRTNPAKTFTLDIGDPRKRSSLLEEGSNIARKNEVAKFTEAEAESARQKVRLLGNIGDVFLESFAPPDRDLPYEHIDRLRRSLVRDILQKRQSLAGLQEERRTITAPLASA